MDATTAASTTPPSHFYISPITDPRFIGPALETAHAFAKRLNYMDDLIEALYAGHMTAASIHDKGDTKHMGAANLIAKFGHMIDLVMMMWASNTDLSIDNLLGVCIVGGFSTKHPSIRQFIIRPDQAATLRPQRIIQAVEKICRDAGCLTLESDIELGTPIMYHMLGSGYVCPPQVHTPAHDGHANMLMLLMMLSCTTPTSGIDRTPIIPKNNAQNETLCTAATAALSEAPFNVASFRSRFGALVHDAKTHDRSVPCIWLGKTLAAASAN